MTPEQWAADLLIDFQPDGEVDRQGTRDNAAIVIRAAVSAEREQWRGWCRALFRVADRHVPIGEFPDELDDARRALETP